MSETRSLDLLVFGATGFTGVKVCEYLASHEEVKGRVRWAMAGRNLSKLTSVRGKLEALDASLRTLPLIEASVEDEGSMDRAFCQTTVVLNCVGPYRFTGEAVVQACLRNACHYLDITGEPEFVHTLIDKYHDEAESKSVKIVPCCGFDCIPADLGALFAMKQMPEGETETVSGIVHVSGPVAISNGTWTTLVHSVSNIFNFRKKRRTSGHTGAKKSGRPLSMLPHWEPLVKAWAAPLPSADHHIVRRSAQLNPSRYGSNFQYGHYVHLSSVFHVIGYYWVLTLLTIGCLIGPIRRLLLKWKQPNTGPDPETSKKCRFDMTLISKGTQNRRAVVSVSGSGCGYVSTAMMMGECALCLLDDLKQHPSHGGVFTTATAMGDALFPRLEKGGVRFDVVV